MKNNLYTQLVDMYAGQELSEELVQQLEVEALANPELKSDMVSLKQTVDALRQLPAEFGEETYQRILMKLYARGAMIESRAPEPTHFQYQLPMQG